MKIFLCTHNVCRSIMAEAIVRKLLPNIHAASAGISARGEVHPDALKYLEKRNYSTQNLTSKSWDTITASDIIITLCDSAKGETCPVWFSGALQVHWRLPDTSQAAANDRDVAFNHLIHTLEKRMNALAESDINSMTSKESLTLLTDTGA